MGRRGLTNHICLAAKQRQMIAWDSLLTHILISRNATVGNSLGLQSQEKRCQTLEPRSGGMCGDTRDDASACRRFATNPIRFGFLGLKSHCPCRSFAAKTMWVRTSLGLHSTEVPGYCLPSRCD